MTADDLQKTSFSDIYTRYKSGFPVNHQKYFQHDILYKENLTGFRDKFKAMNLSGQAKADFLAEIKTVTDLYLKIK